MKIRTRRVYVVECPACRKPIDWSGEGATVWFSRKRLIENVEAYRSCEPRMSLTEWCGCKYKWRKRSSCKAGKKASSA